MAFATAGELRTLLGATAFTDEQTARAELLLELAQGEIEDEAGQPLESSTDTVILDGPTDGDRRYHAATGSRRMLVPRWPVTAVASVTLLDDDQVLTEGHDADYTWSQAGILTRVDDWWPTGDQVIEVTYTAGFTTPPTSLKRICLRLAMQSWDNPTGLTAETLGDHSRKWAADTLGMELSDKDRRAIGAYRARAYRNPT